MQQELCWHLQRQMERNSSFKGGGDRPPPPIWVHFGVGHSSHADCQNSARLLVGTRWFRKTHVLRDWQRCPLPIMLRYFEEGSLPRCSLQSHGGPAYREHRGQEISTQTPCHSRPGNTGITARAGSSVFTSAQSSLPCSHSSDHHP